MGGGNICLFLSFIDILRRGIYELHGSLLANLNLLCFNVICARLLGYDGPTRFPRTSLALKRWNWRRRNWRPRETVTDE